MDDKKYSEMRSQCEKFLIHQNPADMSPKKVLSELADSIDETLEADIYGSGEVINGFEKTIAEVLGKPAAVFMPSGTMAQQIAMRIWSERRATKNIAFHPKCHLEIHEHKAYAALHGLNGIVLGSAERLITLDDLKAVKDPLAAILLELPQREIGGQLPEWEDLEAQSIWAREQGIPLHMDGARLWECKPYYQKEYAEIAALFDTVYVSMYKGLRGISGSILAGPEEFIEKSRIWLRRHGGNLMAMYPYVLSARRGFEKYIERMPLYCEKARQIARIMSQYPEFQVVPNPPQTNMMHVFIKASGQVIEEALLEIGYEEKALLFRTPQTSLLPEYQKTEMSIHEGALLIPEEEIVALLDLFIQKIRTK